MFSLLFKTSVYLSRTHLFYLYPNIFLRFIYNLYLQHTTVFFYQNPKKKNEYKYFNKYQYLQIKDHINLENDFGNELLQDIQTF